MKNFFYTEDRNLEKEYIDIINSRDLNCDTIQNLLKIAYDYADHLFDRRFEQVSSNDPGNSNKRTSQKQQKVQMLYQILNEVIKTYQTFCEKIEDNKDLSRLDILYHLATGNICMRIQQWHLDNYHYDLAERWYGKATGAFWQGVNKVNGLDAASNDDTFFTYRLLLKLNTGKCYRNFANQNRRSNYLAAIAKFEQIQQDIRKHLESGYGISRALALIWADASVNIARIQRHKYQTALAKEGFSYILAALSPITTGCAAIRIEDQKVKIVLSGPNRPDYQVILYHLTDAASFESETETITKILENVEPGDRKPIVLQVLIEFGLLLRKERSYPDAVNTFIAADCYDPKHNIDAINNISSSLRKYITTADADPDSIEQLKNNIQLLVFKNANDNLLDELKKYALQGNLYASREYIRWHCDHFIRKTKCTVDWIGIDSARPQEILNRLGSGMVQIIESHWDTRPEDKSHEGDYNIDDIICLINQLIQANIEATKSDFTTSAEENVQLLYLKGNVELQFRCYDRAIETFEAVCARKEAIYIRRGTLGLKARYQLAKCYMAEAEFRKALEILQEIRGALETSRKSRVKDYNKHLDGEKHLDDNTRSDADPDFRVERDYGYCLMQLGSYQEALTIYEGIHKEEEYRKYSLDQQIRSLNNYASCQIHTGHVADAKEVLAVADEILKGASSNEKNSGRMTALLWGYYYVYNNDRLTAQEYFDRAYGQDYDLNPNFFWDIKTRSQPDKSSIRNVVEQRSAYIINLTKIWDTLEDKTRSQEQERITSFLLDISPACNLSLNAAIALAEWLGKYELNLKSASNENTNETIDQLYRSFASISVYPERGSRAFMEFKTDPGFLYFQSRDRGRILARLFVMYRYINKIKETLCFSKETSNGKGNSFAHLVHYTNISTLKILLSEKAKDTGESPRFRVRNCGYMNDVFEGSVFLDKMRDIVIPKMSSDYIRQLGGWNDMVRKYFPHLVRSEENMIPVGKNVYIASLSDKVDSFPMWSIYANNEMGCNIEFNENFFDILETPRTPEMLQDYLISIYTDDDYPLFVIKYVGSETESGIKCTFDDYSGAQPTSKTGDVLEAIYNGWTRVDTEIDRMRNKYNGSAKVITDDALKSSIDSIYSFAADRINEVRFLFKDEDYQYEGEARVVVTTSNSKKPQIDETMSPPRVYTEVDRAINNIRVRLGSKIDDATVDQLVTWLKLTGKVREVKLSKRNRRTIDQQENQEECGIVSGTPAGRSPQEKPSDIG